MLALPVWLLVFQRYHLYNARHVAGRRDELGRVLHAPGRQASSGSNSAAVKVPSGS